MKQFSAREFVQRFEKFITQHNLINKFNKVVCAVSGGVDSVVMFDLLASLRKKYNLEIIVAHFNHQLRGRESDGDEKFVEQLACKHGVEFCSGGADVKSYCRKEKMSLQQGARELRYKFLQNLCSEKHFEKIATAHNADDNAETILLNLFRGTGVTGLAGIPAKRDNIVRPILFATREEIERYADMKGISFRTDSSNAKEDYRRNFIRLKILPVVKKHINPNILTILNRTAEICGELTHSIRTETETVFKTVAIEDKDKIALDIAKLKNYLNFVQCNVVIWTVRSLSKREVDYEKVNAVLKLMKADTGSSLHVFEDLTAYRDRSNLVFIAGTPEKPVSVTVKVGESHSNSRIRFSTRIFSRKPTKFAADRNVEYIDADLIGEKFTVRMWKDGDWFIPLGMTGKKKISDFLIDNKIPVFEKRRIFVAETDGKIVWLCGLRLDDRFKVTKTTKRIAKIDFRYN